MAFAIEQLTELKGKFTALETQFTDAKKQLDVALTSKTELQAKVETLSKLNADLEAKIKTFSDNPSIVAELTAKVDALTKENVEGKTQLEAFTKTNKELTDKVTQLEKDFDNKASLKAAEIIAGGKLSSPVNISPDAPKQLGTQEFLALLNNTKNQTEANALIAKNETVWKQVCIERAKQLRGS